MATLQELQQALIAADKAGNEDDARRLAQAITAQRNAGPVAQRLQAQSPSVIQSATTKQAQMTSEPLTAQEQSALGSNQSRLGREIINQHINPMLRIGLPAMGMAAGPAAPYAVPALGAYGDFLAQQMSVASGEQQKINPGQVAGAGIASFMPGSSLAGAGLRQFGGTAVRLGLQNAVAKAAETGIDEKRRPSIGELGMAAAGGVAGAGLMRALDSGSAANAVASRLGGADAQETLDIAKKFDLVVPPSLVKRGNVRPNLMEGTLESIGTKAGVIQRAEEINQPKVNNAIRSWLKLPGQEANQSVDAKDIKTALMGPQSVYERIRKVSPSADLALKESRLAQDEARKNYLAYDASITSGRPNSALKDAAEKFQAEADIHRDLLRQELKNQGEPELAKSFDRARTQFARINMAQDAVNPANGNIDPHRLSAMVDSGRLKADYGLGEGKEIGYEIGRFALGFPTVTRELSKVPASTVQGLRPWLGLGLGGAASGAVISQGGGPGASIPAFLAGAAAPTLGSEAAKRLVLSRFFQRGLKYPTPNLPSDIPAMLGRFSAQTAGRQ